MSMPAKKKRSSERVMDAAGALGLEIEIRTMPASTRTAEEAATACGCVVGQIIKSLIFERCDNGKLVLLLISGANQADLGHIEDELGFTLGRCDARKVRAETGFAIGGVAPIGHLVALDVYMDPDLLAYDTVWAAAGSPNAVFSIHPQKLATATGAHILTTRA